MSSHFSANQYEQDFAAHRLGNWEVAQQRETRPQARKGRTRAIVAANGHLLAGKKGGTAFVMDVPDRCRNPARWPQKNSSYRTGASSLMGYKGIPTRYLNSSTITIPTVDKAGSQREQTFH